MPPDGHRSTAACVQRLAGLTKQSRPDSVRMRVWFCYPAAWRRRSRRQL